MTSTRVGPWREYGSARNGLRVYYDSSDLHRASLKDLPSDIARRARYVEAVRRGDGMARVLKDSMGAMGWWPKSTEPKRE